MLPAKRLAHSITVKPHDMPALCTWLITCTWSCFMDGTAWKPMLNGASAALPSSAIRVCATPCSDWWRVMSQQRRQLSHNNARTRTQRWGLYITQVLPMKQPTFICSSTGMCSRRSASTWSSPAQNCYKCCKWTHQTCTNIQANPGDSGMTWTEVTPAYLGHPQVPASKQSNEAAHLGHGQ